MTDEALTVREFVSSIEQEYTIVSPKTKMHKLADIFADNPGHAVLVFDSKRDKFHGILYLYTFLKHYASNPENILSAVRTIPSKSSLSTTCFARSSRI